MWQYLRVAKEDSENLTKFLGFDKNEIMRKSEIYSGSNHKRSKEDIDTYGK